MVGHNAPFAILACHRERIHTALVVAPITQNSAGPNHAAYLCEASQHDMMWNGTGLSMAVTPFGAHLAVAAS